jgi:hypothetical protein
MPKTNEPRIKRDRKPYPRTRKAGTLTDSKDLGTCKSCKCREPGQFNGEIAIHFSGVEGLQKMIVWVFPKVRVCLNCGFTEFTVPERELRTLKQGAPFDGVVVLLEHLERDSEEHPRCA